MLLPPPSILGNPDLPPLIDFSRKIPGVAAHAFSCLYWIEVKVQYTLYDKSFMYACLTLELSRAHTPCAMAPVSSSVGHLAS